MNACLNPNWNRRHVHGVNPEDGGPLAGCGSAESLRFEIKIYKIIKTRTYGKQLLLGGSESLLSFDALCHFKTLNRTKIL